MYMASWVPAKAMETVKTCDTAASTGFEENKLADHSEQQQLQKVVEEERSTSPSCMELGILQYCTQHHVKSILVA